ITGITVSPNKPSRAIVAEYFGISATGASLDVCGTVNNQTTPVTSWSSVAATTTGNDLVFGLADSAYGSTAGYKATGSWNGRLEQDDVTDGDTSYLEDQTYVAAGSFTASGTSTTALQESSVVVAYKVTGLAQVAPAITSANSATFSIGGPSSFTVTAT